MDTIKVGHCVIYWDRNCWAVWTNNDELVAYTNTIDEAKAKAEEWNWEFSYRWDSN